MGRLVQLERVTSLQTLLLCYADITDHGLTQFKGWKNSKDLQMDKQTLFSKTSIADLKPALPNFKINH